MYANNAEDSSSMQPQEVESTDQIMDESEILNAEEVPPQPEPETSEEQNNSDQSKKVFFMPIDQMIELHDSMPEIRSVWGGIKEGSFGYIFGPSKSGKTIFCENLGLSIAAGQKIFMGIPINVEQQRVLFISLEEFWHFRSGRNKMQVDSLKKQVSADFECNYLTISDGFPRYLRSGEDWTLMENTIIQSGSKIVFIDSLTRMIDGQIEDSQTASQVSQRLRDMAYRLRITMVVIHHTRKQNGQAMSIDSLAGSRVLSQEADFMIGISKSPDGTRYMKEVAFRYQQENDEFVYTFKINRDCWITKGSEMNEQAILQTPETDGRRDDTNLNIVLKEMNKLAGEENVPVRSSTLKKLLVDSRIMSKPTFYEAIGKLEKINQIKKIGIGSFQLVKDNQN